MAGDRQVNWAPSKAHNEANRNKSQTEEHLGFIPFYVVASYLTHRC